MALTPKQVRNGIPEAPRGEGGNVAQPGPVTADFGAVKATAEGDGNALQETGKSIFDGGGTGDASVADWDDNIAVTEGAGEA